MVYTEVKERNGNKYYYRVRSIRKGNKVSKERFYLGVNLRKEKLLEKIKGVDSKLLEKRINKSIEKIKPKIIKLLKEYKIKRAGIFGSYAEGKEKKDSDIDILIEPTSKMSLLDLSSLKIRLEKNLNKEVDLVSYQYIHPRLKKRILKEEVKII